MNQRTQKRDSRKSSLTRVVGRLLDPRAPLWQQGVIALVTIALFVVVGMICSRQTGFVIFSGGAIDVFLQYPLLSLAALSLHPIMAFFVGFVGHLILNIALGYGLDFFGLIVGTGVFSLLISLLSRRWHIVKQQDATLDGRRFFAVILLASLIAWPVVSTVLIVLIQGVSLETAFIDCARIGLVDVIVVLVFDAVIILCIKLNVMALVVGALLVAALFVSSYGNNEIGSIVLYVLAALGSIHVVFATFILPDGRNRKRAEQAITAVTGIVVCALAIGTIFFSATAVRYAPVGNEKAVIVLGCSLNGTQPGSILASRLDAAKQFADTHPSTVIVVSGGKGEYEAVSEAQAMFNYLVDQGISESRIYIEDRSSTTAENLEFSLEVLRGLGFDEHTPVVIATSMPHCFRANRLALLCGYTHPSVLGAPIPWTLIIPEYSRELLAIGKFVLVNH